MKRMVITGIGGFIGQNAKEYFEKEYEIIGIGLAADYRDGKSPVCYYQCNMSKSEAELSNILTDVQPDVILHCAGSANVGASVVNPVADLEGNLHSLYHLLLALRAFEKRPKVIFFSSAGVYGNPARLPIRETDAPAPISPYGLHKLMCEQLCHYYNVVHGYQVRAIRIFSAYGVGLHKQLLWDIYQKYEKSGEISLFGTGKESRDFIHVLDIMQAIRLILNYEGGEEVFNVANGEEVSIAEIAAIYAKKLGEGQRIVRFNGETKVGDPLNWRADISLLKSLGYKKSVDLEQGIGDYVDWVRAGQ